MYLSDYSSIIFFFSAIYQKNAIVLFFNETTQLNLQIYFYERFRLKYKDKLLEK